MAHGIRARNRDGEPIGFDQIMKNIVKRVKESVERNEMRREDANMIILDLRDLRDLFENTLREKIG